MIFYSVLGKVTVGLSSHWPCITCIRGSSTYAPTAYKYFQTDNMLSDMLCNMSSDILVAYDTLNLKGFVVIGCCCNWMKRREISTHSG